MAGLDAIDGNEIDGEDTADAGALSAYSNADVKEAIEKRDKLASDYTKYYDGIATRLKERQAGPSFSERMYQLSAALFAPTSTRGFSGVMGNVMPVLQAQQKAQREGERTRQEALEDLRGKALAQQVGLANQELKTQVDLARIAKQGSGPGQWSERFGRYIPKSGPPVPVKVGVLDGRRIVTYTDGNSRLYGVGGNPKAYEILDAAGNVIGQETE